MHQFSRGDRALRRGSLALALGAVAYGAVTIVNPYAGTDDQVHVARSEATALTVYSLLWFVSGMLLAVGAVCVVVSVRDRRPRRGATLTLVGGMLTAAASVASAAVGAFESVAVSLEAGLPDDADLAAVFAAFDSSVVLSVVFAVWLLGSLVGFPLLIGGAARAGLLSGWFVVPMVAAMAGQVVPLGSSPAVGLALVAAFVVPLVVLAVRVQQQERTEFAEAPVDPLVTAAG